MATTNGHGGKRPGAGRPTKEEEETLLEKLRPLDDLAIKMIEEGLTNNDAAILKIFMGYRYGQPKQTIDANLTGELTVNWHLEKTYETK